MLPQVSHIAPNPEARPLAAEWSSCMLLESTLFALRKLVPASSAFLTVRPHPAMVISALLTAGVKSSIPLATFTVPTPTPSLTL